VRDHGRGIPLGKVVDCVSTINTGAKYNDEVFQFSVGLNGVGTKAVNALSKHFLVRSHREGEFAEASFKRASCKERKGKTKEERHLHRVHARTRRSSRRPSSSLNLSSAACAQPYTYLNAELRLSTTARPSSLASACWT
jgi:DNA gyrase/topoisomerase IV subunit B